MEFDEFLKGNRPRVNPGGCWVCSLPEREEVDAAYRKTRSPRLIKRWLVEAKGYPEIEATQPRIDSHIRTHIAR